MTHAFPSNGMKLDVLVLNVCRVASKLLPPSRKAENLKHEGGRSKSCPRDELLGLVQHLFQGPGCPGLEYGLTVKNGVASLW